LGEDPILVDRAPVHPGLGTRVQIMVVATSSCRRNSWIARMSQRCRKRPRRGSPNSCSRVS